MAVSMRVVELHIDTLNMEHPASKQANRTLVNIEKRERFITRLQLSFTYLASTCERRYRLFVNQVHHSQFTNE